MRTANRDTNVTRTRRVDRIAGRRGPWRGELSVEGAFLVCHRAEVERFLRREAARAAVDESTGRIAEWARSPGRLTIQTTTAHLAERLGHALETAFGGSLRFDVSRNTRVGRMTWRRDEGDAARHD